MMSSAHYRLQWSCYIWSRHFIGLCKSVHPWGRVSDLQPIKGSYYKGLGFLSERKGKTESCWSFTWSTLLVIDGVHCIAYIVAGVRLRARQGCAGVIRRSSLHTLRVWKDIYSYSWRSKVWSFSWEGCPLLTVNLNVCLGLFQRQHPPFGFCNTGACSWVYLLCFVPSLLMHCCTVFTCLPSQRILLF